MRRGVGIILIFTTLLCGCGDDSVTGFGAPPSDKNDNTQSTDPSIEITKNSVVIDFSELYSNVDIKRGRILSGEVSENKNGKYTDYILDDQRLGMELALLAKDLNQYYAGWSTGGPYLKSYRSQDDKFGSPSCDYEDEEFSRGSGNEIELHVNKTYLALCKLAIDCDQRIMIQCSGAPVEGLDNGSVDLLFAMDNSRSYHESARYYQLVDPSEYERYGECVADYMKLLYEKCGENDDMIFLGNQEPSHTPGYPNGIQTDEGSDQNMRDYPLQWEYAAKRLKSYGLTSGGVQLNQAGRNSGDGYDSGYELTIGIMKARDIPFDFYSIQNYQGARNAEVFSTTRAGLLKYGYSTDKRVLFNRYEVKPEGDEEYNESSFLIRFAEAEKIIFDNADMLYGYCLFTGCRGEANLDELLLSLNSASKSRRKITALPSSVDGIALGDEESSTIILWNESPTTTTPSLTIHLEGSQGDYTTINYKRVVGENLTTSAGSLATTSEDLAISGLTLSPLEICIIELK